MTNDSTKIGNNESGNELGSISFVSTSKTIGTLAMQQSKFSYTHYTLTA
jgi:hypothetical protein